MTDSVQFSLVGVDALLEKFKSIKYDVQKRGGRSALRKAANLVLKAAQQNAKELDDQLTPEEIAKNVTIRWSGKRYRRTGDLMFRVGIIGGARQYANTKDNVRAGRVGKTYAVGGTVAKQGGGPGGDTFYWRFLEFGTAKMPARPFLRRALSDNAQTATDVFIAEYEKAIDRAIKRAAKKAGK